MHSTAKTMYGGKITADDFGGTALKNDWKAHKDTHCGDIDH